MKTFRKYAPVVGVVIFLYIVLQLDFRALTALALNASVPALLASAVLAPAILGVMAFRWQAIVRTLGVPYAVYPAFQSLLKGALWGEITPGRLGELLRAQFLIADTHCNVGKAVLSVVLDRIYDLAALFVHALVSGVMLARAYQLAIPIAPIVIPSGLLLVGLLFISRTTRGRTRLISLAQLLIPAQYRQETTLQGREFFQALQSFPWSGHLKGLGMSALIWQLKFFGLYSLAYALRLDVPYWFVFSVGAMVTIVSILPISIAGLGTRDALFIFFFSLRQLSPESAVALSMGYLAFGVWGLGSAAAVMHARALKARLQSFGARLP